MNKVLTIDQAIEASQKLQNEGQTIVLAGGCFDILHSGHIQFLEKAKQYGDSLFVLLESDEMIKKTKGKDRPIHSQLERTNVLQSIAAADYILPLPHFLTDQEYDRLIKDIKPTIIATTKPDLARYHKERQARLVNAQVVDVIEEIPGHSTTRLAKILSKDL